MQPNLHEGRSRSNEPWISHGLNSHDTITIPKTPLQSTAYHNESASLVTRILRHMCFPRSCANYEQPDVSRLHGLPRTHSSISNTHRFAWKAQANTPSVTNKLLTTTHVVDYAITDVTVETHLGRLISQESQQHRQDMNHCVLLTKLRRKLHARIRQRHSYILSSVK